MTGHWVQEMADICDLKEDIFEAESTGFGN
jgi:hypothetical protein